MWDYLKVRMPQLSPEKDTLKSPSLTWQPPSISGWCLSGLFSPTAPPKATTFSAQPTGVLRALPDPRHRPVPSPLTLSPVYPQSSAPPSPLGRTLHLCLLSPVTHAAVTPTCLSIGCAAMLNFPYVCADFFIEARTRCCILLITLKRHCSYVYRGAQCWRAGSIYLPFRDIHLALETFPWILRLSSQGGSWRSLSYIFHPTNRKTESRQVRWLAHTHNCSAATFGTNLRSSAFFFFSPQSLFVPQKENFHVSLCSNMFEMFSQGIR